MRRLARSTAGALIVAGGLVITGACAGLTDPVRLTGSGKRVLFIGNSLTSANDLPAVVRALATAAGESLATAAVVQGGYSLEDHWTAGDAANVIASGPWDVVVLQQGPSSLPDSRLNLLEYANRFAVLIRQAGAVPALYMVWPETARVHVFNDVRDSYRITADSVHGLFLPCGEAWRAAWRRNAPVALYSADGLHPTGAGTYLAALVIVQRLTGRSPRGLPGLGLDAGLASLLQDAAFEADSTYH